MTVTRLQGVDEKLARAQVHFDELKGGVSAYLSKYETGMRGRVAGEGRLGIVNPLGEPYLAWSVIFGDCIHNLRSAVEHLAGALLAANEGDPTNATTFPVLRVRPTANKQETHPLANIAPAPGVCLEARKIIDGLQPYQFDDDFAIHPMWQFNELWNHDKHRLLLVNTPTISHSYTAADASVSTRGVTGELRMLERYADAIRYKFVPDPQFADLNVDGEVTLQVALAPGSPYEWNPVIETLCDVARFVHDEIVEPLRRYC